MVVKLVRVTCQYVADPTVDPITFDVFVDEQGVAQKKLMTFGYLGSAKENAERFFPFALRTDGRLGNGSDTGEPDTTDETLNPFGKEMFVGQYVTYSDGDDEYTYRIAKVVDLAGEHQ